MTILLGEVIDPADFYRTSLETQKANSGSFVEETILSGTLPANKMATGRHIRIKAIFSALNRAAVGTSGNCTINLYFGTTLIATLTIGDANGTIPATLEGIIRFNGLNAQHGSLSVIWYGNPAKIEVATGTAAIVTSSEQAVSLKISGSGGAYTTNACTIELI